MTSLDKVLAWIRNAQTVEVLDPGQSNLELGEDLFESGSSTEAEKVALRNLLSSQKSETDSRSEPPLDTSEVMQGSFGLSPLPALVPEQALSYTADQNSVTSSAALSDSQSSNDGYSISQTRSGTTALRRKVKLGPKQKKQKAEEKARQKDKRSSSRKQPLTPAQKREMNRLYAQKSRQKRSQEFEEIKARCTEQEAIIEIYKKMVSIFYTRQTGASPMWVMRSIEWFPSQESRHKTPVTVECFLPDCDEKFYSELGNNAYGQLQQTKAEPEVEAPLSQGQTTETESPIIEDAPVKLPGCNGHLVQTGSSARTSSQPGHSYPVVTLTQPSMSGSLAGPMKSNGQHQRFTPYSASDSQAPRVAGLPPDLYKLLSDQVGGRFLVISSLPDAVISPNLDNKQGGREVIGLVQENGAVKVEHSSNLPIQSGGPTTSACTQNTYPTIQSGGTRSHQVPVSAVQFKLEEDSASSTSLTGCGYVLAQAGGLTDTCRNVEQVSCPSLLNLPKGASSTQPSMAVVPENQQVQPPTASRTVSVTVTPPPPNIPAASLLFGGGSLKTGLGLAAAALSLNQTNMESQKVSPVPTPQDYIQNKSSQISIPQFSSECGLPATLTILPLEPHRKMNGPSQLSPSSILPPALPISPTTTSFLAPATPSSPTSAVTRYSTGFVDGRPATANDNTDFLRIFGSGCGLSSLSSYDIEGDHVEFENLKATIENGS